MRTGALVLAVVLAGGCSKSSGRRMSYVEHKGKPVLEVTCEPGDRIRIVHPTPSDERRCDGKEIRGVEVFPLSPGDFTLGHNAWSASVNTPKGGTLTVTTEFDYAPKPADVNRLFALGEPKGGADAVNTPPEVEASFLPGAPHALAAVADGGVTFTLKAPAQSKLEVGGATFTVEGSQGAQVTVPLADLVGERGIREACAALLVPAKLTRTDKVVHDGTLSITHAVPRLFRALEDEQPVLPPGPGKAHTALMVRDDGECWAVGDTKVRGVAVVVLIDQLRRDLPACKNTPRIALDVAMGAFDPRTGKRKGENTFLAKAPPCDAKHPPKDTVLTPVDPKLIQKWVAKLVK